MSRPPFNVVAGLAFGIVAIAHGYRLLLGLPVLIGDTAIPMWVSWIGVIVPGALCLWAFRARP